MLAMMFAALLLAAATPVAAPEVHRLSPDAVEAAVSAGAERNRAAEALALDDAQDAASDRRKIHGEVGVGVGTGGGREAFGTAVVPLGQTGVAAFSYDYSRWGDRPARLRER